MTHPFLRGWIGRMFFSFGLEGGSFASSMPEGIVRGEIERQRIILQSLNPLWISIPTGAIERADGANNYVHPTYFNTNRCD